MAAVVILAATLVLSAAQTAVAVVYHVSPSGDDSDDGLTTGTAWRTIDNGDRLGVLIPGDTISILPGLYLASSTITLSSSGTSQAPILYTGDEADNARVRCVDALEAAVLLEGNNLILRYVNVSADPLTTVNGIEINGDSCTISGCVVSNVHGDGIEVGGSGNLILRNVVYSCETNGIQNTAGASGNRYYGNTLWDNYYDGIQIQGAGNANRILNNIVSENWNDGIDGSADNVCAHNDVWNNGGGSYVNGVADSAGGISADPRIVNPYGGNFSLVGNSPAIDAGMDLGYAYEGSAPDMGALEYTPYIATNYYVSPSGDDDNDGLTTGSAWLSLENGDRKGILVPGDTVNVLPGTYTPGAVSWLTTSGTAAAPITYRKLGAGSAIIDLEAISESIILLDGDHVVIDSLELTRTAHNGIYVRGDSAIITNCYIHTIAWDGILLDGARRTLVRRNIIANCGDDGIDAEALTGNNLLYNNTVYLCVVDGIDLENGAGTSRVFNNIVTSSDYGIGGFGGDVCGYNDVWDNTSMDYWGALSDSAGGISEDPDFTDPAGGDFILQPGSPAINAGLDLGFSYKGTAPDMGAVESRYSGSYYVSPTGDDDADGLTPGTAWLSIDNGDQKSILVPGDTINVLPGTYLPTSTVRLNTNGTAGANITYRKYGSGDAVVDMNGASNVGILIEGDHVRVDSLEITDSTDEGVYIKSDSCRVRGLYIHHTAKEGLRVEGKHHLFVGNIIAFAGEEGIKNEGPGEYTTYHNNTVYSCAKMGFELKDNTSRLFNNIVVLNDKGINGNAANVCGFNDVWGNTGGDYAAGAFDSAGGISADPEFFDPVGGDFRLQCGSPAINAGLDLGYHYHGSAPDMGALETDHCDSVAGELGHDRSFGFNNSRRTLHSRS